VRIAALLLLLAPATAAAQFSYRPAGELVSGSGEGREDDEVYAPGIRFPIESAPAYANSQVWGRGGSNGGGGSQCDAVNFSYPWRDNYCEARSWDMPLCPSGTGHQGQDIRAATCQSSTHWAVAADDGVITSIGSYSVYLTAPDGTRYDYLHMSDVQVAVGDEVERGDRLGKVSNRFGDSSTTVHLHFNVRKNVEGVGMVFVPPYTSLVRAYEELIGVAPAFDAPPAPPTPDAPRPPEPPDAGVDQGAALVGVTGGCSVGPTGLAWPLGLLLLWRARRRTCTVSSSCSRSSRSRSPRPRRSRSTP
jgi:MYXO-CTERM domain-containing protein